MDEIDNKDMEIEDSIVIMTDEDGNEYYYVEEEVISIGEKRFAILVPVEDECDCGEEHEHDDEETDAIIAKIEVNEDGEDVYCNPTDEEFEDVLRVYDSKETD